MVCQDGDQLNVECEVRTVQVALGQDRLKGLRVNFDAGYQPAQGICPDTPDPCCGRADDHQAAGQPTCMNASSKNIAGRNEALRGPRRVADPKPSDLVGRYGHVADDQTGDPRIHRVVVDFYGYGIRGWPCSDTQHLDGQERVDNPVDVAHRGYSSHHAIYLGRETEQAASRGVGVECFVIGDKPFLYR